MSNTNSRDVEEKEIQDTMNDLSLVIDSFIGGKSDGAYERLFSRLTKLSGGIYRLSEDIAAEEAI